MKDFARRLIVCEAGGKSVRPKTSDTFEVCEKLRPTLAPLMGDGGFRALLSRALALAAAEVDWLGAVHVEPDGALGFVEESLAHLNANERAEGRLVFLAHVLGLLVAFIGENLTVRLMRETWPNARLNNLNLENRE